MSTFEYFVVFGDDCQIEARVRERIAEGWVPLGGVAQSFTRDDGWSMAQAMTRAAPNDDDSTRRDRIATLLMAEAMRHATGATFEEMASDAAQGADALVEALGEKA